MPDYKQGQIYRLWSPHTDKFYIGSTCNMLAKRLCGHKTNYNQYLNGTHNFVSSNELFKLGFDDVKIELIELCPCNSKAELDKREGELIRIHKDNIVNHYISGRTKPEYYQDNRDEILEKKIEYHRVNRDEILEKMKIRNTKYRNENRNEFNTKNREYYAKNKNEINKKRREYRATKKSQPLNNGSISLE